LPRRAFKGTRKVEVENVNHPGQIKILDAEPYEAMKLAFLRTVPKSAPGLTIAEIERRLIAHLPDTLFPKGQKAGWWAKTVQLDLEAKGVLVREKTTPLRLHRA
jgi:hypothetical protein